MDAPYERDVAVSAWSFLLQLTPRQLFARNPVSYTHLDVYKRQSFDSSEVSFDSSEVLFLTSVDISKSPRESL